MKRSRGVRKEKPVGGMARWSEWKYSRMKQAGRFDLMPKCGLPLSVHDPIEFIPVLSIGWTIGPDRDGD